MKTLLTTLMVILVSLTSTSLCDGQGKDSPRKNASQNIAAKEQYRTVAKELAAFIDREIEQKNIPALSIALVDGDEIVWAHGFGFADKSKKKPATAQTIYRVGSVSKLLNDVAVVGLIEQGKLDLDEDIRKVIPEFQPENPHGEPITLRQLMNHTSGLVRESPRGNYFDPTEPSLRETVLSLNDTKLVHAPNTRTKYSNAAVSVAGYAIEKVTGDPFSDYLKTGLLDPIGMTSSSYLPDDEINSKLAKAWMWSYDGRRFEAPTFALGTIPAGNLYSSVVDLAQFMQVVFNKGKSGDRQIISEKLMSEMLTPQTEKDGQKRTYGIGFRLGKLDGHDTFEHGGAVYGFATQFRGLPSQRIGVIAVASLDVANGFVSRVADESLRMMLDVKAGVDVTPVVSTEPVDKSFSRAVAGQYRHDDQILRLYETQNRLMMHGGTFDNEIRKLGDRFVVDDVQRYGTPIEFGDGSFKFEGQTWTKTDDTRPEDAPPRWKGLIGEYGRDHNTLFIYEQNGQLWTLIEWVFHYPLTEIEKDIFAFPEYGLYHHERLIFTRDKNDIAREVVAAEVKFKRRAQTEQGKTFRIRPLMSQEKLRELAFAAEPPEELKHFLAPELIELTKLEPEIKLDIRYASTNNFMGMVFYKQPRAFMQKPAAKAVVAAHRSLNEPGYGLLIHDAYRPWFVTKMFWDATPQEMKHFVANPDNGSRHNRGCAVDLTLYDLKTGKPVPMVAGYDEFSERAYPDYAGGTSLQRWHRRLLRRAMEEAGFEIYEFEWWHFDYKTWQNYPILNQRFSDLDDNN